VAAEVPPDAVAGDDGWLAGWLARSSAARQRVVRMSLEMRLVVSIDA
jgi:hypothetical protein